MSRPQLQEAALWRRRSALMGLMGLGAWPALAAAPDALAAPRPAVLDQPALISAKAQSAAMLAVTRAGTRLVAVGERGIVLLSDDQGQHWRQAPAPVQCTLTCVCFANEKQGWAAGHAGVILYSADGGERWQRQFDGQAAAQSQLDAALASGQEQTVAEARRAVARGADKPFFDLEFIDEQRGFAVGADSMLFSTDDGGRRWQSQGLRLPNPGQLHLYALRAVGSSLVVVGEQGLVLRGDVAGTQPFEAVPAPYKGSFFGLLRSAGNHLVAYGLRGSAYQSQDAGRHWQRLDSGLRSSLGAGVALGGERFLIGSQAGELRQGRCPEPTLTAAPGEPLPLTGLALAADGALIAASLRGMRRLPPPVLT
ncbi:YCF48-related protein [Curvibacter sp. RS43]|uniref:WD40/YVTN/BNR-like repeat-containing protein n=1 Tax=Curvibacter microcysteis TaxID=3026419 RepID=UPI00235FC908|nr:YCF48-related protein [Curvibacter sp. RS43]MDD0809274.1 YCF48-related protein [Curvibacter sp. RS43]